MDTRRLILVLIFTFSSFMLWESWQKYNQPKPPAKAAPAETSVPHPTAALQAGAGPTGTPGAVPSPVVNPGDTFTVATDLVNATISAQGGDIVRSNCSSTRLMKTRTRLSISSIASTSIRRRVA